MRSFKKLGVVRLESESTYVRRIGRYGELRMGVILCGLAKNASR